MDLEIRYARSGDHPGIAEILDAAFGGTAERRIVERLRCEPDGVLALPATLSAETV